MMQSGEVWRGASPAKKILCTRFCKKSDKKGTAMLYAQTISRRPWLGLAWLAAIAIGALLAIFNLFAGLLLLALAGLAAVALAWPSARVPAASPAQLLPSARRQIAGAGGEPSVAFVVVAESTAGYRPVLTAQGYKLVNEQGQVVYSLRA